MRVFVLLTMLTLAAAGCGKPNGPADVTAEMEAAQRQADKEVFDAESRMQKHQKPTRTAEEKVFDAESRMQQQQRGGRR